MSDNLTSTYRSTSRARSTPFHPTAASAGYFGDAGLVMATGGSGGGAVDVSGVAAGDVIAEMHRPGSEINWAVFQVRI